MQRDERENLIIDVLERGLQDKLITTEEYEISIGNFRSFLSAYPDYQFPTSRERSRKRRNNEESEADQKADAMWEIVQPILNKAQGVEKNEDNAVVKRS